MAVGGLYKELTRLAGLDLRSAATDAALRHLITTSIAEVREANSVALTSNVHDKEYVMATANGRSSRPINVALFDTESPPETILDTILDHPTQTGAAVLDRYLYTAGMSFPLARDLEADGDKKSPGTFFEIFVGHIVARRYGVNPIRQIVIPTLDDQVTIPTDYIFELGQNRRIHLPIKLSTRERVVQVWAHQAMLDGMHGKGRFKGLLVCMTETNKQQNTSVVEVCLPNQWTAYQMYIAQLDRVYYLDVPSKYAALRDNYPHIQVWPFSRFFQESDNLFTPVNG